MIIISLGISSPFIVTVFPTTLSALLLRSILIPFFLNRSSKISLISESSALGKRLFSASTMMTFRPLLFRATAASNPVAPAPMTKASFAFLATPFIFTISSRLLMTKAFLSFNFLSPGIGGIKGVVPVARIKES
ncbi:hypothetical protein ES703_114481 [subsurface metagenome]